MLSVFEVLMLVCFGASWPVAVVRAWKARTARGASLTSALLILAGYAMGIINKFVNNQTNYVLYFYFFNFSVVAIYSIILFRNLRLDHQRDAFKTA
jgi:NADH:ubiquinone oxidoreductase subunit 4 (subunit M)